MSSTSAIAAEPHTRKCFYAFFDIVNYSKKAPQNQISSIRSLWTEVATHSKEFKEKCFLPTGDGVCVVLLDESETVANKCMLLLVLSRAVIECATRNGFSVRVGIDCGNDFLITDINGRQNITGDGINRTQRVMDASDENGILFGERIISLLREEASAYITFGKPLFKYSIKDKHNKDWVVFGFAGNPPPRGFAKKGKYPGIFAHFLRVHGVSPTVPDTKVVRYADVKRELSLGDEVDNAFAISLLDVLDVNRIWLNLPPNLSCQNLSFALEFEKNLRALATDDCTENALICNDVDHELLNACLHALKGMPFPTDLASNRISRGLNHYDTYMAPFVIMNTASIGDYFSMREYMEHLQHDKIASGFSFSSPFKYPPITLVARHLHAFFCVITDAPAKTWLSAHDVSAMTAYSMALTDLIQCHTVDNRAFKGLVTVLWPNRESDHINLIQDVKSRLVAFANFLKANGARRKSSSAVRARDK